MRKIHHGTLDVPIVETRHDQDKLKRQYDGNLRVFHETPGVKRSMVHQHVLSAKKSYITAMINKTSVQFFGTLFIMIQ